MQKKFKKYLKKSVDLCVTISYNLIKDKEITNQTKKEKRKC